MPPTPTVAVVVPAYREGRALGPTLASLAPLGHAVVVVDDGSDDDTAAVARAGGAHLLRHPCNLGQGAALRTGLDYALARLGAAAVVTFDADGQHDPADVPRLLAPVLAGAVDVALGSRFLGREAVAMPASRRLLLRAAVAFTRLTTGLPLTDAHNGLRALSADAARRIDLRQNRMAHASELLGRVAALGLRWTEVPVTVRYTPYSLAKGQRLSDTLGVLAELTAAKLR